MKYGNQSNSNWKKFISSRFTLLFLFILFIFLVRGVWNIHQKSVLSSEKLKIAKLEFDKLQLHQKYLSDQISYLSTDQGIESELRTKYRAVRDGESVAVIINNQNGSTTSLSSSTEATSTESVGFFRRVLRMVGL